MMNALIDIIINSCQINKPRINAEAPQNDTETNHKTYFADASLFHLFLGLVA